MRHVVADIETDNLLDELTVIHCLVLRDLETDEVVSCTDEATKAWYTEKHGRPNYRRDIIDAGLAILEDAERVYWHNGISFDVPALEKVRGHKSDRSRVRDTLVIAQMRFAHIKERDFATAKAGKLPKQFIGSHKLEAWGYRLGEYKGEYTDWCKEKGIADPWKDWRPEMQAYCEQDTATTKALVLYLRKFAPSSESIEIEHALAWYLAAQERGGVPFDLEKAAVLQAKWAARREEIAEQMRKEFGPRYKADGKEFTPKKDIPKRGVYGGCAYQKLKLVDFNPGSRHDIIYHLKRRYGWEPTEFTDNGAPKIDEKTLKGLNADIPAVKLLLEYLLVEKRLGQLVEGKEAWLRHARSNGPRGGKITGLHHIHGRIKQNHAITHRAAHSNPNLSAVPKVGKPFGEECRELFYAPDGWVMVGADASGLEARNLAHYLARHDDGAYGELLLKGDVHTANRIALGLPGDSELVAKVARDGAKTWFYAWMYGGGSEKLGALLAYLALADGTRLLPIPPGGWNKTSLTKLGDKLKAQFLKNTPAFAKLIEAVQTAAQEKGYVLMPDGRRAYIRSAHSALNTLLQGAGAIVVKRWIANFYPKIVEHLGEPGWDREWTPLLWSHDEVQIAVRKQHAPWLCELLVSEIRRVTELYHWRIPLDGEAKIGRSWRDTH